MKKMYIVPMKILEETNQWKMQHRPVLPVNPEITKTVGLQSDMGNILKRDDLSESEKSGLFGETLHKFKLSHSKAIIPNLNETQPKPSDLNSIKEIENKNINDKYEKKPKNNSDTSSTSIGTPFCGRKPKNTLIFLSQIIIIYFSIIASIIQLSLQSSDKNLWLILLSTSLGYILPSHNLKFNKK